MNTLSIPLFLLLCFTSVEGTENLMPVGFGSIRLGIPSSNVFIDRNLESQREFLNEDGRGYAVEQINHTWFKRALYVFDNHRLESVSFIAEVTGKSYEETKAEFVKSCIEKYGSKYSTSIETMTHSKRKYDSIQLTWMDEGNIIVVSYTPETVFIKDLPNLLKLQMFSSEKQLEIVKSHKRKKAKSRGKGFSDALHEEFKVIKKKSSNGKKL